jgi:hypothetical protein
VVATVLDRFNNVATTGSVDVTLSLDINPTGATLLATTGLTKATVNGVATWTSADNVHINTAGSGYRLAAQGAGSAATSDVFDIIPAAPSILRFVQQPSDTDVDAPINPPITVQILDAFNNPTAATLPITLSIASSGCGGGVSGDEATSVGGLATFSNLRIDTPCDREILQAMSPGLTPALSRRFEIIAPPQPPRAVIVCGAGLASTMLPMLLGLAFLRRRAAGRGQAD